MTLPIVIMTQNGLTIAKKLTSKKQQQSYYQKLACAFKMLHIYLTSTSPLKIDVVRRALNDHFTKFNQAFQFYSITTDDADKPPQPVNGGTIVAAQTRTHKIISSNGLNKGYQLVISIENGIFVNEEGIVTDNCIVSIETADHTFITHHKSFPILVPIKYYNKAFQATPQDYHLKHLGLSTTVGEIIHNEHPDIDPKNWMVSPIFGSFDRKDQILDPLMKCLYDYKKYLLKEDILYFDNFPKPGIRFKDLSQIIANRTYLQFLVEMMSNKIKQELGHNNIDKVIGLDARGFIYGSLLAYSIGSGFIMARKKGKLPIVTHSIEYGTEYSKDVIEVIDGVIQAGDNVIVVDDLIATGGSVIAAKQLVELCKGNCIGVCCVLQVDGLVASAKEKLKETPLIIILD